MAVTFKQPWYLASAQGLIDWARFVTQVLRQLLDGKINTLGDVTFTVSSTTTTIIDSRISINSLIQLMPISADAGDEVSFFFTTTEGSVTITHASDPATRTFRYVILG